MGKKNYSMIVKGAILIVSLVMALLSQSVYGDVSSKTAVNTPSAKSQIESLSKKSKNKFRPKDSSDSTIEKIKTYEDYLTMYQFIVNEYITNYEAVVTQYGLGDAETYKSIRQGVVDSVKEQKKQYGSMKKTMIIGKKDLVQFLKDYRDKLKEFVNQMSQGLQQ